MAEGRGERTIGSGHLVALFLGIVVLCCVFFILGYEMGRAQYEKGGGTSVAAKPATTTPASTAPSTPAREEPSAGGWPSATPASGSSAAKPSGASASTTPGNASTAASGSGNGRHSITGSLKAPQIPRGAIVLQVAANRNESDALNLAKLLQEKGFPAFVLTPSTDEWYRVQVGPYADAKSAEQAKTALAHEGFKAIAKR
ncbi:MAG TPA: SPOR domain-containing protein [Candidatus Acidoferrales bacterium]|nr:SPOR domain-containing protein [Candidatus Acidoferrales bacterium]